VLVVDASVILKWLLDDRVAEQDTERASQLMHRVLSGAEEIVQPVHWLAEVGAGLARLSPDTAIGDVERLHALELPVRDDVEVFRRAAHLAMELKQHVFDTLYHAVALESAGAILVTADDRYARAVARQYPVVSLSDWSPE
jgi:predicted nucleic acid-binding protein